jgi:GT2 family glycosyltransferase
MYYEDTDLSWRARLKGWSVIHAPNAVVKHIHCGSSGEWSPFFLFHVERNRLAMMLKNGTGHQIFRTWSSYIFNLAKDTFIRLLLIGKGHRSPNLRLRYKVFFSLMAWMPGLLKKRWAIQSARRINPRELAKWFL